MREFRNHFRIELFLMAAEIPKTETVRADFFYTDFERKLAQIVNVKVKESRKRQIFIYAMNCTETVQQICTILREEHRPKKAIQPETVEKYLREMKDEIMHHIRMEKLAPELISLLPRKSNAVRTAS